MKKLLSNLTIFLVILAIASVSCKKKEEVKESSILTVQTVLGDVTIESGSEKTTPVPGSAIKENSTIKTGKISLIDIKYKNSGVIRINENSNVNIARLFSSENADETIMKMEEGKVFVTVSKLLKDSKLQVKTPTSVAGVRGTSFRVSSEKGVSRVDVLAGKVKVNPVKDDKVIESIEKIVEPDKAVEIDQKDIVSIVEEKKDIEIVSLQKEEIEIIKEEAKLIKIDETFNEEIKNEIKEIGIESKPAEEIKDNKKYEDELKKQMEKVNQERETELKEKGALKAREDALKKEKAREEEEKARKDKARREKLEKEKQEKELAQKEMEKQKEIERQKEVAKKEKKKEEDRVKNIPNF